MAGLLLALIYAAFISLGLPDSLLGTGWPVMQPGLGVPYSYAGIASMIIAGGTILSSLMSGRIIEKFGTANTTRFSVLATAVALLGFSLSPSFIWLLIFAIPLGLGGGAVDSALNHFVAAHYKAHHMNWLHCFWGIGAMTGPLIMSGVIRENGGWRDGYLIVALVQGVLVLLLFAARPLWRLADSMRHALPDNTDASSDAVGEDLQSSAAAALPNGTGKATGAAGPAGTVSATASTKKGFGEAGQKKGLLAQKGLLPVLATFLLYCGTESTMGLWGSSFLVKAKGLDVANAAFWVSMFFASITLGRFLSGFVSMKLRNVAIIRIGVWLVVAGGVLLVLPLPASVTALGFLLVGLGCAPIFPSMLHETPRRFGSTAAASMMGIQMATAYTGSTFLPPLFGLVAGETHLWLFPIVVLTFGVIMLLGTERANRIFDSRSNLARS